MGSPALLILTTIPIGIGIALAGVALPGVVKRDFPGRSGAVTGAYVAALSLGGASAALTVVPVADALGGWRGAFAVAAVPAAVVLAIWPRVGLVSGDMSGEPERPSQRAPFRTALVLGLMFGCQGMCFSGMISWVAAIYIDAGWKQSTAALTTASIPLLTIPASLLIAALSDRGDRRLWVAGTGLALALGLTGIALAPTAAAWLWLALVGAGVGAIFPLILTLPLDLAEHSLQVTDLSARMQCIGFSMAATAPVLIGALRDLTGGFDAGLVTMAALAAAAAAMALTMLRPAGVPPAGAAEPIS
jgi:MFS transporter, CP family, cyanate transporter